MYTILVCDDDRDIVAALKIYLSAEGYEVLPAYTGKEALDLLDEHTVHLALMDIMMPVMDGIMATAKLREKTNIPIILLTAKSEDTDKVLGLTIGADDYVTKPFNPMEVVARVKSQLRRYTMLGSLQAEQQKKPKVITIGGVTLDDESKSVTVDGDPVTLTPTEYSILKLLMQNPGQVFSSAQIYAAVWKEDAYGNDSTVAVHIRHLREKIEITPAEPRYVKVVWGQGYKFEKGGAQHEKTISSGCQAARGAGLSRVSAGGELWRCHHGLRTFDRCTVRPECDRDRICADAGHVRPGRQWLLRPEYCRHERLLPVFKQRRGL